MSDSVSRWWAPVFGAMAGFGLGVGGYDPTSGGPKDRLTMLLLGTGVGLAGGLLVMIVEPRSRPLDDYTDDERLPSLWGNVLCALSYIFFFIPFANVVLAGIALKLNWKVGGWHRRLSWLALAIGFAFDCLIVYVWMTRPAA